MAEFTRKEIKGNIYGKLKATGNHYRKNGRLKEEVECLKCGYVHYVDRPTLLAGSAGCRMCSHLKHGLSYGRFYNIRKHINQRCNNPRNNNYRLYGARGIKCLRESFDEFKDDMYESYLQHIKDHGEKETTIDRIDVNGNYCKKNCRWATNIEQANNTRRNVGVFKFSRETGIPRNRVVYRYYYKGLTLKEIGEKFKQTS